MGGSPFLRRAKCFLPTLNGPCRNAPVQKLSKLREAMRFTSRSRAPLLLSLSKQRMVPSQWRSRIASPAIKLAAPNVVFMIMQPDWKKAGRSTDPLARAQMQHQSRIQTQKRDTYQ